MLIVPFTCYFISIILYWFFTRNRRGNFRSFLMKSTITLSVQIVVLSVVYLVIRRFTQEASETFTIIPVLLISVLLYTDSLLTSCDNEGKVKTFVKRILVVSVVVFFVEIFVFNLKSFVFQPKCETLSIDDVTVEENAEIVDESILVSGKTHIYLDNIPEFTDVLIVSFEKEQDNSSVPFYTDLAMTDDNFSFNYQIVQVKYDNGISGKDCEFSFMPYGKVKQLRIGLDCINLPVSVSCIKASNSIPFRFELIRYFVCFFVIVLILFICEWKIYNVCFNSKNIIHMICIAVTIVICMGMCHVFMRPNQEPVEYSKETIDGDPYALTFDAFQKGQVFLDVETDPVMETVDNIYSNDQRSDKGVHYRWDYTYFEGRYYNYFGVTPVVSYYYPYYMIHGMLPTIDMVVQFYSILSVLFLCLAVISVTKLFIPKPNLLLLLLSLFSVSGCSGIYWFVNSGGRYCVVMAAALFYLSLCLWTGFSALNSNYKIVRIIFFFISGLSLALCFGSRPSIALCSAVLIPLYVSVLLDKKHSISSRVLQAVSFFIPLLLGLGGLMLYNNARFGSPFDFGASYQLTVSDVQANRLNLAGLWESFRHYFLMPPAPGKVFPFFGTQYGASDNYQHYVFLYGTIGWLFCGMVALAVVLLPSVIEKGKSLLNARIKSPYGKIFLVMCFVLSIIIAWLDFCLAGGAQQYSYDVSVIILIGSCITLFAANQTIEKYRYILTTIALIGSFLFVMFYLIGIRDCNVQRNLPALYMTLEDLMVFWQ